jgi:hypothetical protein
MMRNNWTLALLLSALIGRVGAALTVGSHFHFPDEAIYVDTARQLAGGSGFGKYAGPPAYPVLLALLSFGAPTSVLLLRLAQGALGALGSVFIFALADRVFGRPTAFVAGLCYALDPLLVITSGLLYPETAAAVLVPLIMLMALDASHHDALARSGLAGALLAVMAMLRPVALILPPMVGVWIALTVVARPARRMAHLGALALVFALVLAPWVTRNLVVHRRVLPVSVQVRQTSPVSRAEVAREGLAPAIARWAWNDPEALVSRVTRQFVQFWELAPTRMVTDNHARRVELNRKDPRLEVRPLFSRDLRNLVSTASFSLELLLAFVGVIVAARARGRQTILFAGVILAYALGYALFVTKLRYRIPVLPLLFLFTGAGAAAAYSTVRRLVTARVPASPAG